MTKIDIISGFLGAGKTTLIRKLLKEALAGEMIVIVENEYGEIGIDGGFLKDAGVQITELNSGCICCTLVGDFVKSLKEVKEKYNPDRIIIEPSGVGKLSDVMSSVTEVEKELDVKLNALITVVNAKKAIKMSKAFGEFFNNQIENATTIVLSRTQGMDEAALRECVEYINKTNPKAAVVTTPWDEIDGKKILEEVERQEDFMQEMMASFVPHVHHHDEDEDDHDEHEHHHHHDHDHDHDEHDHDHDEHEHEHDEHEHHHDHDEHDHHEHHHHHHHHHDGEHDADDVFDSWGAETPKKYTAEKIETILETLSGTEDYGGILRAKGMVPAEDGTWIYFDMVPEETEVRGGEPEITGRICVIGTGLCEDKLKELFEL